MRFLHGFKFWACPMFQGWKIKNDHFSKRRSRARFLFSSRAFRDPCMSVSAPLCSESDVVSLPRSRRKVNRVSTLTLPSKSFVFIPSFSRPLRVGFELPMFAQSCCFTALHAAHLSSRAKVFAVVACRYQTPLRSQRFLVAPNCMHQIHIVDTRHRRFRALAHFPIFAPSLSRHFLGKAGARERPPEARESRSLEKLERGKAPLGRGKADSWKNWSARKAP